MAIGESKRTGLFSNFKGLESGDYTGTVNTKHSWSEFETEPLIKKEILTGLTTDATLNAEVVKPVTRRLEDVARITKLLAKPGGIKWEAHQAELQTIQNELEIERAGGENTFKSLLKSIGGALVTDLTLTASTLAQVAVAGTGEHQTPFIRRAYLHDGGTTTLGNIFAALGLGDSGYVNGGALTMKGKTVVGRPVSTLISPNQSGYRRDGNQARVEIPSSSVTQDWTTVKTEEGASNSIVSTFLSLLTGTTVSGSAIRGEVDGDSYEKKIASKETALPSSSISPNQDGVRDRNQKHAAGSNETKSQGPKSAFISDGTYVPEVTWHDNAPSSTTGPKVAVPHVAVDHSESYSKLVKSTITSGSLPASDLASAEKSYNPTGSVQQWSGRAYTEFSDQQGKLNNDHDGFRMTKQFYSSSNRSTTYEGFLETRDPELITVQDRIRGKVTGTVNKSTRRGGQTIKIRDKWSNSLYVKSVDTVSSAEKQFMWTEDEHREVGLVPFEISSINPEMRYYMAFEASLDSFNDSYSGNWNGTQYVGRAENFYVYNGFDRQIDFSFKAFASRPEYLYTLYRKLNVLAGTTAPTYKDGVFMRGTLTSVSIGDLLVNQIGFFKGVKFGWKTDYMWELDSKILRVPLVLDVSINFTPIHDFVPESVNEDQDEIFFFGGERVKVADISKSDTPDTDKSKDPEVSEELPEQPPLKLPDPENTLGQGSTGRYISQGDGLYYDTETGKVINTGKVGVKRGQYTDYPY